MPAISLATAADAARTSLRSLRRARTSEPSVASRAPTEPDLDDEANWLDLDLEEQAAFDEKLSNFLDLDVENKERDWLLPNG